VTIANRGTSTFNGWTARWTAPSGQTIGTLWNGTYTQSGSSVTVRNASYNGAVAPNSSTTFGFNGSGSATPAPTVTCTSP
jgi:endo-1,4-beta-xylanase